MIAEYIENALAFEQLAAAEKDPQLKADFEKQAAAYRKLRRAGFAPGAILTVLKRFAAHPELLDEPPPEAPLRVSSSVEVWKISRCSGVVAASRRALMSASASSMLWPLGRWMRAASLSISR